MRIVLRIVALFTRAWIEIIRVAIAPDMLLVALFTRAWIEIKDYRYEFFTTDKSPSSRGRGLKYPDIWSQPRMVGVALFTRAWIEISLFENKASWNNVALFTRAWIEIRALNKTSCVS